MKTSYTFTLSAAIRSVLLILIFLSSSAPAVFAQQASTTPRTSTPSTHTAVANTGKATSHVQIQNCTMTQQGSDLAISCDFVNAGSIQSDLKYSVQLVGASSTSNSVVDEKVYSDAVTLGQGKIVHKSFSYTIPAYASGKLNVMVNLFTSGGMPIGITSIGSVQATAKDGSVYIDSSSCKLEDPADTKYNARGAIQIIGVPTDSKLALHCTISNPGTKEVTVTPSIHTYTSKVGEEVTVPSQNTSLTLAAGEKKEYVAIISPLPTTPHLYYAILSFTNGGEVVSNAAPFEYRVQGISASIDSVTLDNTSYAKGDIARALIGFSYTNDVSGSSSTTVKTISAVINSSFGKTCGETTEELPRMVSSVDTRTLVIPMSNNCSQPSAVVSIKDSSGNVLAEKTLSTSGIGESTHMFSHYYAAAGALFLIGVVGVAFFTRKLFIMKKTPKVLSIAVILILSTAGFFAHIQSARADGGYYPYQFNCGYFPGIGMSYTCSSVSWRFWNLNKTTFDPGEQITATLNMGDAGNSDPSVAYPSNPAPMFIRNIPTGEMISGAERRNGDYHNVYLTATLTAPTTPGTYTVNFDGCGVFASDCSYDPSNTMNITYTVVAPPTPQLTASCSVNPGTIGQGDGATWSVSPSGGTGAYSYNWSGDDGLSGNSSTIYKTYSNTGTKNGSVSVTSGSQNITVNCNNSVTVNSVKPPSPTNLQYSCNPAGNQATLSWNPSSGADNYYVRYQATNSGSANNTDGYSGTSITVPVTPGQAYNWWIHSNVGAADYNSNHYSDQTNGPSFTCNSTIPAQPTYMNYSCNAAGTQVTMSWDRVANATEYRPRLRNADSNQQIYSSDSIGDVTSVVYAISPNVHYQGWVHGYNSTAGFGPQQNSVIFSCGGQPNLTVQTAPSGTTSTIAGTPVSYSGTVKNIGSGTANGYPNVLQVLDSTGTTNLGYYAATPASVTTSAGGSSAVSGTVPASSPFATPGTYQLRFCANMNTSGTMIIPEGAGQYSDNCGPTTTVTVTPYVPPAPTATLIGGDTTLTWSSTNATTCTGGGFNTGNATSGGPTTVRRGTYTLTCTGPGGTATASADVGGGACTNPMATLSAAPNRVQTGSSTVIAYTATGITTSCTLSGPGVNTTIVADQNTCAVPSGSVPTGPLTTQSTYIMTCDGVERARVIVNVVPTFKEF